MSDHSTSSEEGLVGTILLDPIYALSEAERNGITPEHFKDLRLRQVYEVLQDMASKRETIGSHTLYVRLREGKLLDACGGAAYLSALPDGVPSAANAPFYIGVMRENHYRRKAIEFAQKVKTAAEANEGELDNLIKGVETELFNLAGYSTATTSGTRKDSFLRLIDRMEEAQKNKGAIIGLPTGLHRLDYMIGGLRDGALVIIAARPGMGKSSLCMQIGEHNALDKRSTGVFTLEMTEDELNLRSLGSHSRVDMQSALRGEVSQLETPRLIASAGILSKAPIHIRDSITTLAGIQSEARRLVTQHGVKLIIIDYLQLVRVPGIKHRVQEVGEVSRGLKMLAKELKVPVVAAAQISREIEKDAGGRRPRLADLRESGDIEQDADVVAFIWEDQKNQSKICVAKNRNGGCGEIDILFDRTITRFTQQSPIAPGL
jgi:replicative DNA helicase